jgi:hypothetical protein
VEVLAAAQPGPSHTAAIEDQREAALHQFGTELERLPGLLGQQPSERVQRQRRQVGEAKLERPRE